MSKQTPLRIKIDFDALSPMLKGAEFRLTKTHIPHLQLHAYRVDHKTNQKNSWRPTWNNGWLVGARRSQVEPLVKQLNEWSKRA